MCMYTCVCLVCASCLCVTVRMRACVRTFVRACVLACVYAFIVWCVPERVRAIVRVLRLCLLGGRLRARLGRYACARRVRSSVIARRWVGQVLGPRGVPALGDARGPLQHPRDRHVTRTHPPRATPPRERMAALRAPQQHEPVPRGHGWWAGGRCCSRRMRARPGPGDSESPSRISDELHWHAACGPRRDLRRPSRQLDR